MKRILIKIGSCIAILLMFSPILIVYFYKMIGNYWWLVLLLSICYDAYMYSNILKNKYIENVEERYRKYIKSNKILGRELNDSEHLNICKDFIEEIIDKLKKD